MVVDPNHLPVPAFAATAHLDPTRLAGPEEAPVVTPDPIHSPELAPVAVLLDAPTHSPGAVFGTLRDSSPLMFHTSDKS